MKRWKNHDKQKFEYSLRQKYAKQDQQRTIWDSNKNVRLSGIKQKKKQQTTRRWPRHSRSNGQLKDDESEKVVRSWRKKIKCTDKKDCQLFVGKDWPNTKSLHKW